MATAAIPSADAFERLMKSNPLLSALDARLDAAEHGYVEISAPADRAAEMDALSTTAMAALAEAAARWTVGPAAETAELSLHLHGRGAAEGAARLIARGELLRDAPADRPLAAAQADVFRIDASGGESLLATALVTILAQR